MIFGENVSEKPFKFPKIGGVSKVTNYLSQKQEHINENTTYLGSETLDL